MRWAAAEAPQARSSLATDGSSRGLMNPMRTSGMLAGSPSVDGGPRKMMPWGASARMSVRRSVSWRWSSRRTQSYAEFAYCLTPETAASLNRSPLP